MANPHSGNDQANRETGVDAATFFGAQQFIAASAPGRVNLLGEHTDYNDGFMLPVATPQCTTVSVALNNNPEFEIYSSTLGSAVTFGQDGKAPEGFAQYIEGCIRLLQQRGVEIAPLRMHVTSNLPLGTGLSSSAALEVATLRALRALLGFELDDRSLALIAQQSEIQYAHVNCGIMDQMASSLADSEHMLFLDARTLETRLLAIPAGSELIVIDSGMPRTLAASAYNVRRAECEAAAKELGVQALRDVANLADVERLAPPLRQRARHVVSENQRVLEAAQGVPAERFGELMNDSHYSLRDDYEVSIPELDELCELLRAADGVHGARLTGAGFGGAVVALCRSGAAAAAGARVVERFNASGRKAALLLPTTTDTRTP
ncbi:galactokinase [Massilia sp. GCM10020059]|uniref:Galactokinase n=1 Tax=Massilia agrisoli TaxID=2892444 RepID=A0ABS8IQH7_9BURK|nr:galactokinase [Massilia agrisoli]MCC6070003.1 galactokinase [Massilia agrisoli]